MMTLPTPAEIKARIEAMSPEERKAFVNDLCKGVNEMAASIVENADAIWESRNNRTQKLH